MMRPTVPTWAKRAAPCVAFALLAVVLPWLAVVGTHQCHADGGVIKGTGKVAWCDKTP